MPLSPRTLRPSQRFTPRSISGLALWLDASDASTLAQNSDGTVPATTAGDPVGYWSDKSGNGRNATQSTAASRPTVTTVNGRKALAFDGSNDSFIGSSAFTLSQPTTWMIVAKANNAIGGVGQNAFDGSTNRQAIYREATTDKIAIFAGSAGSITATWGTATQRLVGAEFNGASSRLFVEGAPSSALNPGASSYTYGRIGTYDGTLAHWNGSICEMLLFSRALTSTERRRLEQYLATRWGITLAPQVSDPDAQDWVNRVYAAGSTVSTPAASAVNDFVVGCKADGIWTAMQKVLLLIGVDTFAGCAVPLKGTAPTFTNFSSANYSRTAGLQGVNTGYIRAGMLVSGLASTSSMHLAAWQTAANTASATTYLALGQSGSSYLRDNVTSTWFRANSVEILQNNARANAGTMIGMARNSTTQYGILNGSVSSAASAASNASTSVEIDLMGASTTSSYLGRVSFFSFGDNLDLALLDARVSTLMNTLGSL